MKLFAKLLVLVLVMALAGPFILKGPNGQPLMRVSDVTQKFKAWMGSSPAKPGSSVELHRWQDENGQWHYSDQATGGSETITIDPNVNVIQATPVAKPAQASDNDAPPEEVAEKEDKLPSIFHPVDETNKVKEELEQRNKDMLKRLDDT
ncbi:MAG: DUF4124 domain-containing protein [Gammaproteobacteria bacterium]